MTGAHKNAAFFRHQGKDVTGPHEIRCSEIAVGQRTHRVGALFGGNPGAEAVADVNRNGESSAEWRVVQRHHGIEMQSPGFLRRKRGADDPRRMTDDERHLFRRA